MKFLSIFFTFFTKKRVSNQNIKSSASSSDSSDSSEENVEVSFNKKLIKNLVKDHKILLSEFTSIISSVNVDNFEHANKTLASFTKKILEHLELENIDLYVYLEFMANITKEDKEIMKGFRNEMSEIATAVTGFINRYTNDPIGNHNKNEFLEDANSAAGVLVDRINREESILYPMYGRYKK